MLTPTKMIRKASFSKLIDMAVSISVEYSYGPVDTELYNTKQDREQARKMIIRSVTVDEKVKENENSTKMPQLVIC